MIVPSRILPRWFRTSLLCGLLVIPGARAWSAAAPTPSGDVLVYRNGDRVSGRLVSGGAEIVFQSDRFGELRVPATEASVQKAGTAPGPTAVVPPRPPAAPTGRPAASPATAPHAAPASPTALDRFSPAALTAHVRDFFGPWQGRVALSVEAVQEVVDRDNTSLDLLLKRKWTKDDVQMSARFDYVQTNEVATTDMIRGAGSWRHDFSRKHFVQYRPSVEWNRANRRGTLRNRYVLLQQELGVGYNVLTTADRKLRTGVSYNSFELWNTVFVPNHTTRNVQSLFEEIELKLPWQMGLSQRGVWYPVGSQRDGWDNRVEVSKKLTETLSTSVRHELRRNNPDGSAQDYTRLKLLFGFDF
jgi:hypothetical protein